MDPGKLFDCWIRLWLNVWFSPYYLMSKGGEVDQWTKTFSLNGAKENVDNHTPD